MIPARAIPEMAGCGAKERFRKVRDYLPIDKEYVISSGMPRETAVAIHSYEDGVRIGLAWYRVGAAAAGFPHDRREL